MMDITKAQLYIVSLNDIIKGKIAPNTRFIVNGRKQDGFIYITSGNCRYIFEDGKSFIAEKGNVIYLANNSFYNMKTGDSEYSFVYCDFKFSDNNNKDSTIFKFKDPDIILRLFEKLYRTFIEKHKSWHTRCLLIVYNIYTNILENSEFTYVRQSWRDKVEWAHQYIKNNPNVNINEIAKKLNISEVYFRKLFKSIFNASPSEYITFSKIERAKTLMEYPFLSLEECAIDSGFSSVQYFCRVFKKVMSITPAQYRRKYIK